MFKNANDNDDDEKIKNAENKPIKPAPSADDEDNDKK